jgi:hypothetical protein
MARSPTETIRFLTLDGLVVTSVPKVPI